MKRRIVVPGRPLHASVIISDAMKRVVVAVPHYGEVIVVFIGQEPTARAMTEEEALRFKADLKAVHEAARDDVTIARMEKEFGDFDG